MTILILIGLSIILQWIVLGFHQKTLKNHNESFKSIIDILKISK